MIYTFDARFLANIILIKIKLKQLVEIRSFLDFGPEIVDRVDSVCFLLRPSYLMENFKGNVERQNGLLRLRGHVMQLVTVVGERISCPSSRSRRQL